MKIRTEFIPIQAGRNTETPFTVDLRAWRATFYLVSDSAGPAPIINGVSAVGFMCNMFTATVDYSPTSFVIGGVVVDGRPVNIDQVFTFSAIGGGIVVEYIDE